MFESCFNIEVPTPGPLQCRAPGARLTVAPDGRVEVDEDAPGALARALAVAVAGPDPVLTADHGSVQIVRDAPVGPVAGQVRTVDVDQTHRSWVVDGTLQVKVGGTVGALDHGADQARRAAATGAVPMTMWMSQPRRSGGRMIRQVSSSATLAKRAAPRSTSATPGAWG